MKELYYFRSTKEAAPEIIEAKREDFEESFLLETKAKAFAGRFGAVPLFTQGLVPIFFGVTFVQGTRPAEPRLWSTPKANDRRMAPKLANVPHKLRAHAQRLGKEWDENYPHDLAKPRTSHLLAALGLREEDLPGNAMYFFIHKDVCWIAYTQPLDASLFEEVTCSEYVKARTMHEMEQAQIEENARKAMAEKLGTSAEVLPLAAHTPAANEPITPEK